MVALERAANEADAPGCSQPWWPGSTGAAEDNTPVATTSSPIATTKSYQLAITALSGTECRSHGVDRDAGARKPTAADKDHKTRKADEEIELDLSWQGLTTDTSANRRQAVPRDNRSMQYGGPGQQLCAQGEQWVSGESG